MPPFTPFQDTESRVLKTYQIYISPAFKNLTYFIVLCVIIYNIIAAIYYINNTDYNPVGIVFYRLFNVLVFILFYYLILYSFIPNSVCRTDSTLYVKWP